MSGFFLQTGNIAEVIQKEKAEAIKTETTLQPFMIVYKQRTGALGPYFLAVDDAVIELRKSAVEAIDTFFKLHYVLNVHFSKGAANTFTYLARYVYGLKDVKVTPSVSAFNVKLENIVVDV